ncbi:hypothetical protein [Mesorhizobium sp. SP-1A]|jgi:hypothetical protein|uniref:hypothetical protein n=1 Tax=Mesorhizobium sp. SP-1A TaxID=3077840 RepID=UPI0028F70E0F|nr:hypothetical protein [Mesorhizobium sp. SP-1A]
MDDHVHLLAAAVAEIAGDSVRTRNGQASDADHFLGKAMQENIHGKTQSDGNMPDLAKNDLP